MDQISTLLGYVFTAACFFLPRCSDGAHFGHRGSSLVTM